MIANYRRVSPRFSFTLVKLLAALAATLAIAPAAHAVLYWDANGNLAGSGTWDVNTTQNWRTTNDVGPPDSTWTPNDGTQDAAFGGNPGAGVAGSGLGGTDGKVTVSGTINVHSLIMQPTAGNYSLSGGAINITDPANSIVMNTNTGPVRAQVIASAIGGTDITVVVPNTAGTVNSFVTLGAPATGATNTFTGDLIFGGPNTAGGFSQININNPTALPATATVRMMRNLCQLLFTAGGVSGTAGYTATFNNNIILNDTGSGTLLQDIGASAADAVITLGGVISGDANLRFQVGNGGGNGTIVLANNSTYTGSTNITGAAAHVVRLGINNALPVGTALSVNRGFDMAGFNQNVAGLNSTAAGNGTVTNTGATTSTLTIDGNATGSYFGLIGASGLTGSNDNIALVLAPTNTGTLTLSRGAGNTYNGGTTINGGKLVALAGDSAVSATGTGAVAANNGGTLGGNGGVGGPITVASGGHLAPGPATGTTIGTLSVLNALSLGSGSNLDMDLGAPGTSDRIDMPSFFGNFALTVPAAANSIGVNLIDPAGGAAGNGTYTLMMFQAGQYTGSSNATQFFTNSFPSPNSLNGATIAYNLADDTNTIQDGNPGAATRVIMTVTGGPNALLWTGAASGTWDTGTTANFNNLATNTSTTFAGNDNVTFDDTGANTTPVTIVAGGVQPNIVTINNSNTTYTFSGGDINGSSLGGGGGLFLAGTGPVTIDNNYTAAGPIVSNKSGTGSATFNGNITAATALTVNGGTLTLAGANTYTGDNTVNGGTLAVSGSTATFGGGDLTVNAGSAAISAGVLDAILDTATLTLLGGGAADMADVGFIDLAAGIDERIGSLVLDTTAYTIGTFGSLASAATFKSDEYFSGSGIISVGAVGVPGDYNGDGKVDAADYVVWRKNPAAFGGDPGGYTTWRANFGAMSGGGASTSGAVPEPACLALLLVGLSGIWIARRYR
ncbi:MAG: autotransporter-associated beta strand repeat-containing protein [Pirellulales bacterium]